MKLVLAVLTNLVFAFHASAEPQPPLRSPCAELLAGVSRRTIKSAIAALVRYERETPARTLLEMRTTRLELDRRFRDIAEDWGLSWAEIEQLVQQERVRLDVSGQVQAAEREAMRKTKGFARNENESVLDFAVRGLARFEVEEIQKEGQVPATRAELKANVAEKISVLAKEFDLSEGEIRSRILSAKRSILFPSSPKSP